MKTAERVSAVDASDNFVLARSVLAYREAARIVGSRGGGFSGDDGVCEKPDVLEIGTGTGYGVGLLAPVCRSLVTVDKFQSGARERQRPRLLQATRYPDRRQARAENQPAAGAGGWLTSFSEARICAGAIGRMVFAHRRKPEVLRPVRNGCEAVRRARGTEPSEGASINVEFRQMTVPPLDFPDASFDFVVTFQVIEHIRRDGEFLSEIARVLRPDGKLIITTPNRKMSLTRNPWHVREYTAGEFSELLGRHFGRVETSGVFGDERVMEYFERNRRGVACVARWDILRLTEWLPRWILRVPYDVANRLNRRRLLAENEELTRGIRPENYFLAPVSDEAGTPTEGAFDLFYVGERS